MAKSLKDEINRLHAQVCSGLADPNRILILYTLAIAPHNVSELATSLEIPQPTVSRHLKVLRERNMVHADRDGQSVYYSLADDRIIQALDLLRGMLADSLENQVDLARTASETLRSNE
ncbi:MAG TPA: metalloregulator ArsR/SmtB family transcription factor [Anaerolineales bacterium]|nr:metalloregulator ArsR/SmtB family transcription factor [Anaerolineales bacterium]